MNTSYLIFITVEECMLYKIHEIFVYVHSSTYHCHKRNDDT